LGAAERIEHLRAIRECRGRFLRRGQCSLVVAISQQPIDKEDARCRFVRVELDRLGEQTRNFVNARAGRGPHVCHCQARRQVFGVGCEQLIETLARLLRLLVTHIEV